jgi:hypothetical protein
MSVSSMRHEQPTGRANRIDLRQLLKIHDTSAALTRMEDVIICGAIGTNVNDLKFAIVEGARRSTAPGLPLIFFRDYPALET